MSLDDTVSVGEALDRFRRANGMEPDEAATWSCQLGPLRLRLPNFRWRRRAIARHDLHHLLTGYPCTMRGEFQMAAWEFAAGRFPHLGATLFCLPLVAAGVLWSPSAIWRAYRDGRQRRSLYGSEMTEQFFSRPFRCLRASFDAQQPAASFLGDAAGFALVVVLALLLVAAPAAAIVSLALAL